MPSDPPPPSAQQLPRPWEPDGPRPALRLVPNDPPAPAPHVNTDPELIELEAAARVGNDVLEHLTHLVGEDDPVYVSVLHRVRRHAGDTLDGTCRC